MIVGPKGTDQSFSRRPNSAVAIGANELNVCMWRYMHECVHVPRYA